MNKVWVYKFRESDPEDHNDYVVVFASKPSREQMDEQLLTYLDQLFIDHNTTLAKEKSRKKDPNKFHYPLYYEELLERGFVDVNVLNNKESLEEKLADLYEWAEKSHPDVASVISMAEDTLRKSK